MSNSPGSILVVDDDSNLLEIIRMRLESAEYKVTTFSEEKEAVDAANNNHFDLAILDLQLAKSDGISLMENIHKLNPDVPVIILTAYGTIKSAVSAMQKGAYSYLTKPFEPQELLFQVDKAIEKHRLTSEIERLKGILEEKYGFVNIIARSKQMQETLEFVSLIAKTDSTVHLNGESGTGKELIARAIHLGSNRKDKAFVAINCAALPENLLESELFGYKKGAFTGAGKTTKGLFVQADEGTLLLDEIANMPYSIQAKMLRVLQERQFYPVGGKAPVKVDVRIIVATNKDLKKEVEAGTFREDLFYRIHVIPITLPPLRDRRDDIPPLTNHFIDQFNQKMNKKVKSITPAAMQKLMLYNWPGNVRELENTIEYAMALTRKITITEELILVTTDLSSQPQKALKEAKADFEKQYLTNILGQARGNVSKASELAGKYRADFYYLLKKHHLNPHDFKSS